VVEGDLGDEAEVLVDLVGGHEVHLVAVVGTAAVGLELVVGDGGLDAAGDRGAEGDVGVAQAGGGGGQEDVGPAVEGVTGSQRGLEGGDAAIGAEHLVAEFEAEAFVAGGELGDVVVGVVVGGVVAVIGLGGVFGAIAEGDAAVAEGLGADETEAVGGAGGTKAGGVFEIQQVGVGGEFADGQAGVGCVDQVRVGVEVGEGGAGRVAEDALHLPQVGVGEIEFFDGGIFQRDRVEGLHVLAPADVSDEAGVVQDDDLAADLGGGAVVLVDVTDPGLADLGELGVGHDGVTGGGLAGLLVVVHQLGGVLGFDAGGEAVIGAGGVAEAGAQGERVGVGGGLVNVLVAEAGVEGSLALGDGFLERGGSLGFGGLGGGGASDHRGDREALEVLGHVVWCWCWLDWMRRAGGAVCLTSGRKAPVMPAACFGR